MYVMLVCVYTDVYIFHNATVTYLYGVIHVVILRRKISPVVAWVVPVFSALHKTLGEYIYDLVQDCSNSSAPAMKLLQSCAKLSMT